MKNIGVAVGGGKAFAVNPAVVLFGLVVIALLFYQVKATNHYGFHY